jgi:4-amino-4-deoxy-L-arabinose transferase-like glycosyltransferase
MQDCAALRRPRERFLLQLAALAALGLILRLLYVAMTEPSASGLFDQAFYHATANLLADGKGYIDPFANLRGDVRPTALHPPLYPFSLSVLSLLGVESPQGHRLLGVGSGAALVFLAGLLGRRVAGERVGIVAAGLTAVYPTLIRADGTLLTETVYAPLVVAILLVAYRLRDRPTPRNALLLGALVGVAAHGRLEALLFVPLLVLPLAWRAGPRRLAVGGLAVAATVLVLTPWLVRNWTAFDEPPRIAHNGDSVIAGANCEPTYDSGDNLGGWSALCWPRDERERNEARREGEARRKGMEFAFDHVDRWPEVVAARVLRTWSLRGSGVNGDGFDIPSPTLKRMGHGMFLVLAAFGIAGIVLLRRQRIPLLVLLAPLAAVTVTSAVGWGLPRFRHAAEVPIVVLASVAVVALADRLRDVRSGQLRLFEP